MPTPKKKKKVEKVPKPIKIKKEKTEEDRALNTMAHYIDDRLELVKQIFGSLKPKTINNLAPDFLKTKSMEDIEELCLNELLGISSKRLLSVINATKCPTDTESSSDSDVEHQEEHISLEEISSDSEDGTGGSSKRAKSKQSKGSAKNSKSQSDEPDKNGHISVLELLELQARARAIRSQLALEPVTKIEVNSDSEETIQPPKPPSKASAAGAPIVTAKLTPNGNGNANTNTNGNSESSQAAPPQAKKIRLKRHFLNKPQDSIPMPMTVPEESEATSPTSETTPTIRVKAKGKPGGRSPSPDVIPIVAEPETVYISDNSDEDLPIRSNPNKTSIVVPDPCPSGNGNASVAGGVEPVEPAVSPKPVEQVDENSTETEEGEITEGESESEAHKKAESAIEPQIGSKEVTAMAEAMPAIAANGQSQPALQQQQPQATIESIAAKIEEQSGEEARAKSKEKEKEEESRLPSPAKLDTGEAKGSQQHDDNDDEQNDDVISIEGGDLESVLTDNDESSSAETQPEQSASKTEQLDGAQPVNDCDVIALDTSDEEAESWQSRYLKSSKVSKVLAASRLGKRVRDKIKSNKREQHQLKKSAAEQMVSAPKSPTNAFVSKHEDGSIEQYKELLQMNKRNATT